MENRTICCGFGHRDVITDISAQLDAAVNVAIMKGCNVFMVGGNGAFDTMFAHAVRKAKHHHPHVALELVRPYYSNTWNLHKDYYIERYDAIMIPEQLLSAHYKSAIGKRNRWMVDQANFIIAFVYRDYGGAYSAVSYAEKIKKDILYIAP